MAPSKRQSRCTSLRCDGANRRDFLRLGGLTALGLGLSQIGSRVRAEEHDTRQGAAERVSGSEQQDSKRGTRFGRAKRCVLIWLDGGPSHLETFDLKPHAPREVRGPFQPIATRLAGETICELMPRTAENMRDIAIIRSVTSPLGEHNFGTHYLLTGYKPTPALEYPSLGAVVAHQRTGASGRRAAALPPHIAVPHFRVGGGGMDGAGFLGSDYQPFSVGGDPAQADFRVRDLDFFPGMDRHRLDRRRRFLQSLDRFQQAVDAETDGPLTHDPEFEQAYRLITSPAAKQAFVLEEESPKVRRRYGIRTIGQSCLLARRLIERGVPFVTVNNSGWDTHNDAYTRLKEGYTGAKVPVGLIPSLDLALNGLLDDLRDRGLLDETLVVVMGEFGRTPKLNTLGGRDHWPRVFSVAMAGAGIPGQIIGKSDAVAESPQDRPVTPADLAATLYHLLGIDPDRKLYTPEDRPIEINRDGELIRELVS